MAIVEHLYGTGFCGTPRDPALRFAPGPIALVAVPAPPVVERFRYHNPIANKWAALAIWALDSGPQRFGALRRTLRGVTPKVLTHTLRRLEDAQLLTRTVLPEVPLHVVYELTELGGSAASGTAALRQWAEDNID